ncbi:serine protease Do [Polynucleobacter kasalickyi]|uniref:Probable periplasmic serine endoprotease DegP-like n=1 Tax=Polynucleobacter kasalickyi TaxID=1938817 RepID=A0A1W1YCM9_9BURK|nr:serine protease Do [Polynucleobacter kasalickyi]
MNKVSKFNKLSNGLIVIFTTLISISAVNAQSDSSNNLNNQSSSARRFIDFADLVEKASPAVVNIRTTEKVMVYQMPSNITPQDQAEFFRRFFGIPLPAQPQPAPQQRPQQQQAPQAQEQNRGTGSGFILDSSGYILTNAHVVEGATNIYVTLTDKREFKAKLIGSDPRTDVALVKVEAKDLPKLPVGDSSKVRVGEWVLAIGSPFGLDNTVTAGIISAKGRETNDSITPFIQTDVAINPGNSGGPLINTRGEVIGINSQIYSKSGGYMGISFAIPIDEAIRISEQLKTNGRIVRGRIGVTITELTKELSESIGFTLKSKGVLVRGIEAGAPAAMAGIEVGDVVVKINDREIEKSLDLTRTISDVKPGTRVKLQVWRKGSIREINVMVVEVDMPRRS